MKKILLITIVSLLSINTAYTSERTRITASILNHSLPDRQIVRDIDAFIAKIKDEEKPSAYYSYFFTFACKAKNLNLISYLIEKINPEDLSTLIATGKIQIDPNGRLLINF